MMSQKSYSEKQVIDIIERVLENRNDIDLDENFLYNLANYTLKSASELDIIVDRPPISPANETNDKINNTQLSEIIKMLAIINKLIDLLSLNREGHKIKPEN